MSKSQPPADQPRRYQGYPYINPVVIDVPTLDAATAAKWANLPRRPITNPTNPVPRRGKNETTSEASSDEAQTESSRVKETEEKKEDPLPVVYIDVSDEENGAATSSSQQDRGQENLSFVQDTILFDPFENRPINLNKSREQDSETPGGSTPGSSSGSRPLGDEEHRPQRPNRLHLNSPSSEDEPSPSLPAFMNKESQVYGQGSPSDGFALTPLPVTDYPEPPPAYTEVARPSRSSIFQAPRPSIFQAPRPSIFQAPPRTVVVVPEQPPTVGLPSLNRKFAKCQNCNLNVHTVVVNKNGAFTHFVALITVILCMLPITVLVYCTNFFKYKVHFCPNCNHRIGHEIPILCKSMEYD